MYSIVFLLKGSGREITLLDKVSLGPTIRASMKPLSNSPEFAEAFDVWVRRFEYHHGRINKWNFYSHSQSLVKQGCSRRRRQLPQYLEVKLQEVRAGSSFDFGTSSRPFEYSKAGNTLLSDVRQNEICGVDQILTACQLGPTRFCDA